MAARVRTSEEPRPPADSTAPASPNGHRVRPGHRLAPLAGPALITAAVLLVLWPFALGGRLSTQHVDLLPLWLPTHCFLGSQLAAGHIPAWNPFVMGGTRFAADPQSGWLYLPAMVLYAALPCARAIGWFIALQPIMAGLGLYAFLRSERAARAAATVGGLCLALSMAASYTTVSLPFSGALAWTTIVLAAASRLARAEGWASRLLWLLVTALAWGQLASAHMSQGVILGTVAVGAYLGSRVAADAVSRRRTLARGLGVIVLLAVVAPLVNLGILLPRLNYFEHSSLASGYQTAEVRAARLEGAAEPKEVIGETGVPHARWPLAVATTPGAYLGVGAILLVVAGLWSRRHRYLAAAFVAFGGLTYLLSLRSVAMALAPHLGHSWLHDLYLHAPARMRFGVVLAAPVLAGLGADAWRDHSPWRRRAVMVLPAVAVFGLLPTALGYRWAGQVIPLVGLVVGAAALTVAATRPRALWVVPAVLAVELVANGVAGQANLIKPSRPGADLAFFGQGRLHRPTVDAGSYLRAGPIADAIRSGGDARVMPLMERGWEHSRGYLIFPERKFWPLLANQRAMLFGIEDVGGSDNPLQSARYWSYVRAVTDGRPLYNAAFFTSSSRSTLDLMQVGWTVQPIGNGRPSPDAASIARQGRFQLFQLPRSPGRASVVPRWILQSPRRALGTVSDPDFVPERVAVLEAPPRFPDTAARASGTDAAAASFAWRGTQAAVVHVRTPHRAILLVRNTYDPGWHATVDGDPVALQPADYIAQGVPVPPGRHVVELAYDDPTIGYGLLGSGLSIALLLGGSLIVRFRGRRRRPGRRGPRAAVTPLTYLRLEPTAR